MLEKDCIHPNISPHGALLLFVCNNASKLRMCIDYHVLNHQTNLDVFPIPRIADLLDYLGPAHFSRWWTWQLHITKSASNRGMSIVQLL